MEEIELSALPVVLGRKERFQIITEKKGEGRNLRGCTDSSRSIRKEGKRVFSNLNPSRKGG